MLDIPCGGIPDSVVFDPSIVQDSMRVVACIVLVHQAQSTRRAIARGVDPVVPFRDMRVAYLLGDISAEKLGVNLEKLDWQIAFRRAILQHLDMLVLSGTDILQRASSVYDASRHSEIKRCILELGTLKCIFNDEVHKTCALFGRAPSLYITTEWDLNQPYVGRRRRNLLAEAIQVN